MKDICEQEMPEENMKKLCREAREDLNKVLRQIKELTDSEKRNCLLYTSRDSRELGISAVRGGTIVGDHDVIFAGTDEVVTFEHRAYSRAVFGKGAIQAAKFLAGKPAGRYDMSDVIG